LDPASVALFATPLLIFIEWWRRSTWARLLAVFAALVLLFFAEPEPGVLARTMPYLPANQRITTSFGGQPLSDYQSGVATTIREAVKLVDEGRRDRLVAIGVLVWLSLSQLARNALVRYRVPSAQKGLDAGA
jgi:hypothetical protein